MTNKQKQELWRSWIEACMHENKKRLTKWEEEFLESISDQLDRTGSLSERPGGQVETLERIYAEKT